MTPLKILLFDAKQTGSEAKVGVSGRLLGEWIKTNGRTLLLLLLFSHLVTPLRCLPLIACDIVEFNFESGSSFINQSEGRRGSRRRGSPSRFGLQSRVERSSLKVPVRCAAAARCIILSPAGLCSRSRRCVSGSSGEGEGDAVRLLALLAGSAEDKDEFLVLFSANTRPPGRLGARHENGVSNSASGQISEISRISDVCQRRILYLAVGGGWGRACDSPISKKQCKFKGPVLYSFFHIFLFLFWDSSAAVPAQFITQTTRSKPPLFKACC